VDKKIVGYGGTPVIPAFRKLRQEVLKFEASLGYMARPYLKINKQKK
jgi:hypothetical protein